MSWFKLKEPMGTNYRVDPGDIVNTKQALTDLGYYKIPPHRGIDDWTDDAMFDGIRSFQKDNDLKVDGFMRPGGPTERTINTELAAAGTPAPTAKADKKTCAEPAGFIPGTIWDRILRRQGGGGGGGRCYPDRAWR